MCKKYMVLVLWKKDYIAMWSLHMYTYTQHLTKQPQMLKGMQPPSSIFYTLGANIIHLWVQLREHCVWALITSASSQRWKMRGMGTVYNVEIVKAQILYVWLLSWKLSNTKVIPKAAILMFNFCSYCLETFRTFSKLICTSTFKYGMTHSTL